MINEPVIIQGGMGVAVSAWRLARAVSVTGQLGVVAGTGLDVILSRRLQSGDPGGHVRRAMEQFPYPALAQRVLERNFIKGGKAPEDSYKACPMPSAEPTREQLDLLVVANFVEVFLAKEGHEGLVGINYLEKIQVPTLPSLFGAMLAGVDYVLMGAGIPRAIPGILDQLSRGEPVELALTVKDAERGDKFVTRFDPADQLGESPPELSRPKFLAIISSAALATMLARRASGRVDGFVVEGPSAGGHNAPPRGAPTTNERGEPVYGDRDIPDLESILSLERPVWLAGSYGSPDRLAEARALGATGIQVGTAFAYCDESGLAPDLKRRIIALSAAKKLDVFTDPVASPAGFPFKVVRLPGSISEAEVYDERTRRCDLGFLRHAYKRPDGSIGWRCSAENADVYAQKGGAAADTVGRKCVCNGLLANIGLGQVRGGISEKPLVTSGEDVRDVYRFLPAPDADSYAAADVVRYLLSAFSTSSESSVSTN